MTTKERAMEKRYTVLPAVTGAIYDSVTEEVMIDEHAFCDEMNRLDSELDGFRHLSVDSEAEIARLQEKVEDLTMAGYRIIDSLDGSYAQVMPAVAMFRRVASDDGSPPLGSEAS